MEIHEEKIKQLEEMGEKLRQDLIEMFLKAGSGHTAGPLGMADIFTAFYFHILNHNPENPNWEDRDRLVLSNGHICPVQYVTMALAGYFPTDELKTLRKINSRLQGQIIFTVPETFKGNPHRLYRTLNKSRFFFFLNFSGILVRV